VVPQVWGGSLPVLHALLVPLYEAVGHGHAAVTEQLIDARCNVDLQMKNGVTPLHVAAQEGYATVKKKLIEARCNVNL